MDPGHEIILTLDIKAKFPSVMPVAAPPAATAPQTLSSSRLSEETRRTGPQYLVFAPCPWMDLQYPAMFVNVLSLHT